MNFLRMHGALTLAVVGALTLAGCSGDDDKPDGGGTPTDTGPTNKDAGGDAGTQPDSGRADTGVPPSDGGTMDAGPQPTGDEGQACGAGNTCNSMDLTCVDLSATNADEPHVRICLRGCQTDGDCAMSTAGTLCRPIDFDSMACVSTEVAEGLAVNLSAAEGAMSGCELDLLAIPSGAGSGLFGLEDYQRSCARPCNPAATSGPTACTNDYPYCNPQMLNSTTTPGLCALRRAMPGDVCSRTSVVGMCDTSTTPGGNYPQVICVGVPIDMVDLDDPGPAPAGGGSAAGLCFALCDFSPNTPTQGLFDDCTNADDPVVGPATCKQAFSQDPDFGICSNECDIFPDTCGRPSPFGLGSSCTDPLAFDQNLDAFTFCRSVIPPVIPEWDWVNAPADPCLQVPGGEGRCEAHTRCEDNGMGGACVRYCAATSTAATGCEAPMGQTRTATTCDDGIIGMPTDGFGVCVP